VGFGTDVRPVTNRATGAHLKEVEKEDLLKFGLIPEFIGRLPVIPQNPKKNALTKQYARLFEMENVPLVFTDDSLRAIAKKAIARKNGARGLRSILEGVLLDLMYDLPSASDWAEVIVTKDTI